MSPCLPAWYRGKGEIPHNDVTPSSTKNVTSFLQIISQLIEKVKNSVQHLLRKKCDFVRLQILKSSCTASKLPDYDLIQSNYSIIQKQINQSVFEKT